MAFVAEQRPLSNLLLLHVWDSRLLNPTNYTILLCLIISALAGINTEAHFPVCCTTLLFRVPIARSGAAPAEGRVSPWEQRRRGRWDGDLGLFLPSSVCVTSRGLCVVPGSWEKLQLLLVNVIV